jgi:hypothetical protein
MMAGYTVGYIIGLIILVLICIWVYKDSIRRGRSSSSAGIWAVLVFILLIIFLPIYLITRPRIDPRILERGSPKKCSSCNKYYDGHPQYCPNCGVKI